MKDSDFCIIFRHEAGRQGKSSACGHFCRLRALEESRVFKILACINSNIPVTCVTVLFFSNCGSQHGIEDKIKTEICLLLLL